MSTPLTLDALKDTLPAAARDVKLNLGSVLTGETLSKDQIWGVALSAAFYAGELQLRDAILNEARAAGISNDVVEDAQAAAAIMGMNTVYYRFRHLVGKESYTQKPARLRMQWMASPKTGKMNFELFSMGIAVLAGCEMCIKTHEASILKGGLSEDHVHEAVRIASVVNGVAVALRTIVPL